MELYRADFDVTHLAKAEQLAGEIVSRFKDGNGGFYRTACDGEKLFIRPKEVYDGAIPSGNSAAGLLLTTLAKLTGKAQWLDESRKQLDYLCAACETAPAGCAFGYLAVMDEVYGGQEIVLALPDEQLTPAMQGILSRYAPELTVLKKTPMNGEALAELAPFTAAMEPQNGKAACYICKDGACSLPVTDI
jgi:hypothetical protein